jgi:hypothetical protein
MPRSGRLSERRRGGRPDRRPWPPSIRCARRRTPLRPVRRPFSRAPAPLEPGTRGRIGSRLAPSRRMPAWRSGRRRPPDRAHASRTRRPRATRHRGAGPGLPAAARRRRRWDDRRPRAVRAPETPALTRRDRAATPPGPRWHPCPRRRRDQRLRDRSLPGSRPPQASRPGVAAAGRDRPGRGRHTRRRECLTVGSPGKSAGRRPLVSSRVARGPPVATGRARDRGTAPGPCGVPPLVDGALREGVPENAARSSAMVGFRRHGVGSGWVAPVQPRQAALDPGGLHQRRAHVCRFGRRKPLYVRARSAVRGQPGRAPPSERNEEGTT